MLNEYELVYIVRPDLDDAATNEVKEKVDSLLVDNGGVVLKTDDWGKRKLAYQIGKHFKGHYVIVHHASQPDAMDEVERRLRYDERVIRFVNVKRGDVVDVEARRQALAEAASMAASDESSSDAPSAN